MVSRRLRGLVTDPVDRTYLDADDGYWADLVLAEFAFLEERGGRIEAVSFHQHGDYVTYVGPWGRVSLDFAPDNYPDGTWIGARADLRGHRSAFSGELDRLARERRPDVLLPTLRQLDRASIASNVRLWADVLRSAHDLF